MTVRRIAYIVQRPLLPSSAKAEMTLEPGLKPYYLNYLSNIMLDSLLDGLNRNRLRPHRRSRGEQSSGPEENA